MEDELNAIETEQKETGQFSRRAFIGGAVGALGAASLIGLAACSPQESKETEKEAESTSPEAEITVSPDAEELEYDVLVLGGGTSGSCAALAAVQKGAKTLIVEKTDVCGGLSTFSGVIAATETSYQKEAGYDITTEELVKSFRSRSQNTANLPLVRNIFSMSAGTIDWMEKNGMQFLMLPAAAISQGSLSTNELFTAHLMRGTNKDNIPDNPADGAKFEGIYSTYIGDYGGEVMLETKVVKLLTDSDGEIEGVLCEKSDGSQVLIHAKAYISALGSWNGDTSGFDDLVFTDKVHQFAPSDSNVGDGITLAESIGAQRWCVTPQWHNCFIGNLDGSENWDMRFLEFTIICRGPYNLWVNYEGTRFADESVVGDFVEWANCGYSQGGGYYIILDQEEINDLEANGTPTTSISAYQPEPIKGDNPDLINAFGLPSGPMTGLQRLFDEYVAAGNLIKADTLEELATKANFDQDEFKAAIESYNAKVAAGIDEEFYKDSQYLIYPIKTGPFYAMRTFANTEGGMLGGVRVNKHCQVLKKETGRAFKNFYAAGYNAGGFYGTTGSAHYQGCSMSFAVNSGRMVGELAGDLATS